MSYERLRQRILEQRAKRIEINRIRNERDEEQEQEQEQRDEGRLREIKIEENYQRRLQAWKLQGDYLDEEQRKRDQIEYDKSEEGRMEKAREHARINRQRDIDNGLTAKEREFKYSDKHSQIIVLNKRAQEETDEMLRNTNRSKFKTNLKDLF